MWSPIWQKKKGHKSFKSKKHIYQVTVFFSAHLTWTVDSDFSAVIWVTVVFGLPQHSNKTCTTQLLPTARVNRVFKIEQLMKAWQGLVKETESKRGKEGTFQNGVTYLWCRTSLAKLLSLSKTLMRWDINTKLRAWKFDNMDSRLKKQTKQGHLRPFAFNFFCVPGRPFSFHVFPNLKWWQHCFWFSWF